MNKTTQIPNSGGVQWMYSVTLSLGQCYEPTAAQAAIED